MDDAPTRIRRSGESSAFWYHNFKGVAPELGRANRIFVLVGPLAGERRVPRFLRFSWSDNPVACYPASSSDSRRYSDQIRTGSESPVPRAAVYGIFAVISGIAPWAVLLPVAAVVGALAWRLNVPYSLNVVLAGIVVALFSQNPPFGLRLINRPL